MYIRKNSIATFNNYDVGGSGDFLTDREKDVTDIYGGQYKEILAKGGVVCVSNTQPQVAEYF